MTGFYKNMETGNYDAYRDTDEIERPITHRFRTPAPKKGAQTQKHPRDYRADDLHPVGEDDEY
ncbi:MAG: hypothetical protein IIU18_00495 [Oscillospiraceae bacterium]|nr:hypothetical protein [Oscillospiraceae bacterium]